MHPFGPFLANMKLSLKPINVTSNGHKTTTNAVTITKATVRTYIQTTADHADHSSGLECLGELVAKGDTEIVGSCTTKLQDDSIVQLPPKYGS